MGNDKDNGSEMCTDLEEIFIRIKHQSLESKEVYTLEDYENLGGVFFIHDSEMFLVTSKTFIDDLADRLVQRGWSK